MVRWNRGLLASALLICLHAPAGSEIYRWKDEQGTLHFTQSLDQVPLEHRKQAQQPPASPSVGSFQAYSSDSAHSAYAAPRTLRIPFRQENGLMRVTATVNGHLDLPFYIDTGASGVSIPSRYAKPLGIAIGPDTPHVSVRTANGVIQVPLVRLDSVVLGQAEVNGLMATINPTMDIGLLGGTFFNNFSYGVDPAANVITLEPNYGSYAGLGETDWRRRFQEIRLPLAELEVYLEENEISRKGRREELEQKLAELRDKLAALELEANRDDIPMSWRH